MSGSDPDRKRHRSLLDDERAIEGLPIRLVIALVVGVAALGIMMQILTGLTPPPQDQEVDVKFNQPVVSTSNSVEVTIVDAKSGEPIPEAFLIVQGDTLSIENTYNEQASSDGKVSIQVGSSGDVVPDWRTTQDTGEISFTVRPPSDSPYADNRENTKLMVTR